MIYGLVPSTYLGEQLFWPIFICVNVTNFIEGSYSKHKAVFITWHNRTGQFTLEQLLFGSSEKGFEYLED